MHIDMNRYNTSSWCHIMPRKFRKITAIEVKAAESLPWMSSYYFFVLSLFSVVSRSEIFVFLTENGIGPF